MTPCNTQRGLQFKSEFIAANPNHRNPVMAGRDVCRPTGPRLRQPFAGMPFRMNSCSWIRSRTTQHLEIVAKTIVIPAKAAIHLRTCPCADRRVPAVANPSPECRSG
jgi:hypothetical protein